jgi:hypothetical protein
MGFACVGLGFLISVASNCPSTFLVFPLRVLFIRSCLEISAFIVVAAANAFKVAAAAIAFGASNFVGTTAAGAGATDKCGTVTGATAAIIIAGTLITVLGLGSVFKAWP